MKADNPLLMILLVALSYFLLGMLGQLMAIPPGYATLFWPASGVALGAALIWGGRALPGVFLGSLLVNIYISSGAEDIALTLALPALIAFGAALQAFVGALLVKKLLGFPFALHQPKQILNFCYIAGALACLVNATFSCLALWLMDVVTLEKLPLNWFNWWLGDALGVVIVTPWLLALFPRLSKARVPNRRKLLINLLLVTAGTALFSLSIALFEQKKQAEEFNKSADILTLSLKTELHIVTDVLYSLKSFVLSHEVMNPELFRQYTLPLLDREPSLHGLSWNRVLSGNELAAFEQHMAAQYADKGIHFKVTRRDETGKLVAASPMEKHVVVSYIEPLRSNLKALGYDVYSQKDRRDALDMAQYMEQEIATRPIRLVQEKNSQAGVLIFLPVFSPEAGSLQGFVTAVLRVGNLASRAFDKRLPGSTGLVLFDDKAVPDKQLLFSLGDTDWSQVALSVLYKSKLFPLQRVSTVNIGQETWTLALVNTSSFLYQPVGIHLMLICGLIISALLNWFLVIVAGQAYETDRQVIKRTTELSKTNELFQRAEKLALVGNWESNLLTGRTWWSDQLYRILGHNIKSTEPSFQAFLALVHPDDLSRVEAALDKARNTCSEYQLEHRICLPDGSQKTVIQQGLINCDEAGNPRSIIGIMQDISHRKAVEQELQAQKQRLDEIIWSTNVGTWEWNIPTGEVTFNERWAEIVGLSLSDLTPGSASVWHLLMHPDDLKISQQILDELFQEKREYYEFECRMRHHDGHWVWVMNRGKVIEWEPDGKPLRMCGTEADITTRKLRAAEIEKLATTDTLTGLVNRDYFNKRLDQTIKISQRTGQSFALMMLDLDGFKQINDKYGHITGDALLVEFARDLQSLCRETDIIARVGGDEFMIILTTLADSSGAEVLAQRIIRQVNYEKYIDGHAIHVGVSIGISQYPDSCSDRSLIQGADKALYDAKKAGRNTYKCSD